MAKKSKHDKGAGSTPATVQLEKAGVEFHVYEYEHSNDHMDDGYGVEAATKLGFDEHQVFKTLMADTEGPGCGCRCQEGLYGRSQGGNARIRLCGRWHLAVGPEDTS